MLIKERREWFVQKRKNAYKRCYMVNSKEVSKEWVQDRSQTMVIIGSDAVSLYPIMTKQEAADEVAEAVMESNLKWEGVNWKEATRYMVLGRDEKWCRSSNLLCVLPRRRYNHGSRPGLTGVGPLGAEADDANQWKFKNDMELTEWERRKVIAEVLRLSIELMYSTHLYSVGGRSYKQKQGGPIGLRSMCALARVVMGRWDTKWKDRE